MSPLTNRRTVFLSAAITGTTWIEREKCVTECLLLMKMAPQWESTEGNGRAMGFGLAGTCAALMHRAQWPSAADRGGLER